MNCTDKIMTADMLDDLTFVTGQFTIKVRTTGVLAEGVSTYLFPSKLNVNCALYHGNAFHIFFPLLDSYVVLSFSPAQTNLRMAF